MNYDWILSEGNWAIYDEVVDVVIGVNVCNVLVLIAVYLTLHRRALVYFNNVLNLKVVVYL